MLYNVNWQQWLKLNLSLSLRPSLPSSEVQNVTQSSGSTKRHELFKLLLPIRVSLVSRRPELTLSAPISVVEVSSHIYKYNICGEWSVSITQDLYKCVCDLIHPCDHSDGICSSQSFHTLSYDTMIVVMNLSFCQFLLPLVHFNHFHTVEDVDASSSLAVLFISGFCQFILPSVHFNHFHTVEDVDASSSLAVLFIWGFSRYLTFSS